MIKYTDECVGCPPEMGCLGDSCRNRNVPHYICDTCGEEFDPVDPDGISEDDWIECDACMM